MPELLGNDAKVRYLDNLYSKKFFFDKNNGLLVLEVNQILTAILN
jgi:hypothetical protein